MKVETFPLENRILKVIVEASSEELETARRTAVQRLGKKVRIPGFRPGKAPYPILLKHLDPILLQEETIEAFLDEVYPKILESENIDPIASGELHSILNYDPLRLEIHIPLKPLVELGDYHSIRVPYEPPTVTDEMVEEVINDLRQQQAIIEPVERPVQEGDLVYLDLIGYLRQNGEKTDQIILEEKDFLLEITNKTDNAEEYPFQGFHQILLGKQAGEQIAVDFSYPANAPVAKFQGQDIHFEATIKEVKRRILPQLDDEFAQSIGEFSSVEEMRNGIRSTLEKQLLEEYLEEYDSRVTQELINCSKIEYPLKLAEVERKAFLSELENRLHEINMDIELYNKVRGISEEQFEEEINHIVDQRVKVNLVMREFVQKEGLRINADRVRELAQKLMEGMVERSKLQRTRIPPQMLQKFSNEVAAQAFANQMFMTALERLRSLGKGEERVSNNEEEQQNITLDHVAEASELASTEEEKKAGEATPISEANEQTTARENETLD